MRVAPTFSVVMPAFETEATVGDAIRSVLAQRDGDFELIVVDDGSSDGTAAAVQAIADDRMRLIETQNRGAAAARNTGVEQARGRLVAFVDSDDLWLPSFLAGMRRCLDGAPAAGLCYTDAWTLDPQGRVGVASAMHWQRPPPAAPPTPEALLLELLDRNFVYASTTVTREVFERVGGFDESLRAAIDYEMWLRVAAHSFGAVCLPGRHGVYRRGRAGSISANRTRVFSSLEAVYERVAVEWDVPPAARTRAAHRLAAIRRERVASEGEGGLGGMWRAGVRPFLIAARNRALRRDDWLEVPPPELVDALPWFFGSGVGPATEDAARSGEQGQHDPQ